MTKNNYGFDWMDFSAALEANCAPKYLHFKNFVFSVWIENYFFIKNKFRSGFFCFSAWMSARLNLIPDRFPSGIWVSSFFHQNLDEIFFQNLVEKSTGFTSDKDDKRTEASSRAISFMIILREAANPCSAECLKLWCLVWFAPSQSIFS